jgi:tetratricopeptide (TPR) repeat protein
MIADEFVKLVEQAARARRENRLLDARRDLVRAIELCRQAGVPADLARALMALGQIERDLGRGEAARPLYEEAVSLCRSESDTLRLAHTVRHLGDLHQDSGRLDLAEPCYEEALALYRSTGWTAPELDLANAIRPLAILKERLGNLDAAIQLWREARDLYLAVNVQVGVAECSKHLNQLGG